MLLLSAGINFLSMQPHEIPEEYRKRATSERPSNTASSTANSRKSATLLSAAGGVDGSQEEAGKSGLCQEADEEASNACDEKQVRNSLDCALMLLDPLNGSSTCNIMIKNNKPFKKKCRLTGSSDGDGLYCIFCPVLQNFFSTTDHCYFLNAFCICGRYNHPDVVKN